MHDGQLLAVVVAAVVAAAAAVVVAAVVVDALVADAVRLLFAEPAFERVQLPQQDAWLQASFSVWL